MRRAQSAAKILKRAEFVEHIGRDNILPHIAAALRRAAQIFGEKSERPA
jgi:hypothetical protein